METMKIGEFARRAGVNVQTVRYYERRGLLPEPERQASGYREYGADSLDRLQFIRRAQELGFTLAEIQELLALRTDPDTTAAEVKGRAEAKIADIDARLRDLQQIRHALQHLAGQCRGGTGPAGDCPLLAELGSLGSVGASAGPSRSP
ncbi:MAG TPA: heavy metal-responsive transcriptional regulator [Longimicrobiales bacterium]|nr:heavy metal-responsive transcriptional regulator [Longimicrobiales bacterium]